MFLPLNKRPKHALLFLYLSALLLLPGCGGSDSGNRERAPTLREQALSCTSPYEYIAPSTTEYGINTSDLTESAIDDDLIVQMLSEIHCGGRSHGLNSVLIDVDGELVVEEYFPGFISASNRTIVDYDRDTIHVQASVQKSFISALIGIAADEGYLDIQETLYEAFPEYSDINWFENYDIEGVNHQKSDITIEDFLLMAPGFEWNEYNVYYGHPDNPLTQMNASDDPTRFILELPLTYVPGEVFQYNTGLSDILELILERKTGMSAPEYAQQTLFSDLAIDNFYWPQEYLMVRPIDMLKLGKTYLNGGMFEGQEVVPQDWVTSSLTNTLILNSGARISGYGYQWWVSEFTIDGEIYRANAAFGYGGQQIYIFHDFDAVVTFTSAEYPGQHGDAFTTYSWLQDYIVPALIAGSES